MGIASAKGDRSSPLYASGSAAQNQLDSKVGRNSGEGNRRKAAKDTKDSLSFINP